MKNDTRCSTLSQDLEAQRKTLHELGVHESRIYTDHGLTGTNRERPGLDQALAALCEGDTLVVSKLDRLARAVPDARTIAEELRKRGVKRALGATVHDPTDPMGKMFFNIVATFAEFEADLITMRTRGGHGNRKGEGQAARETAKTVGIAAEGTQLWRMHDTGEYSISDLAEVFSVSRPTIYRTLNRRKTA